MADIKWIKITTNIFNDEKILLIEALPEADSIIVIWFKILTLAGKQNSDGILLMNNRIPYTDEMLATIFRRNINTVRLALKVFEEYGMIEIINGAIAIPNWEKHQNIDGLEKIREQNRIRKQNQRERQKQALLEEKTSCDRHVTVTQSHATEEDKEKEEDKDKERDRINYQAIVDMYNDTCVSFPRLKSLSESRKKAIKARLNTYSVDDFKLLFEKAENSDFLKGGNDRNWSATFDWLIKDSNMAKVLEGNYDGKSKKPNNKPVNNGMPVGVEDPLDGLFG
jgi:predicted phage replisome organizer